MKKIILTGGAGFIGSNLLTKLLESDVEKIVIIDDLSTGSKENIINHLDNKKVEFINSKIEDIDNLDNLFVNANFC